MTTTDWIRTCEGCGSDFRRKPGKRRARFCSKSCASTVTARARTGDRNSNWRGGMTSHPLYDSYLQMVARCHDENHPRYADYGGRGITVCDRWRDDFWTYVADVGARPEGMSLDRIDNDSGYRPDNVRWATASQQVRNSRPGWVKRHRNEKGQFA